MAIKRSTCLTVNRSRWFSLASERRMNDTQTVFDHFNFAVTFRSLWRRSSSPSLRSTRIGVAPFRKFHICLSFANSAFPIFYTSYSCIFLSTSFLLSFYQLLRTYVNTLQDIRYEISLWTFSSCLRTARFSSQGAKQRYADVWIYPVLGLPTNTRNNESHLIIACGDIETKRGDRSESERRFSCLTAGFCTRVALVYTTIKCLHLCLS